MSMSFIFLVGSSLTEAVRILKRIIEWDSDIDISEDETRVSQAVEGKNSEEEADEDNQEPGTAEDEERENQLTCAIVLSVPNSTHQGIHFAFFSLEQKGNIDLDKCIPINAQYQKKVFTHLDILKTLS